MEITHHFGGNTYAKGAKFSAGEILVQHKHNFDHLSILATGSVELLADGVKTVLNADQQPVCLNIAAGKHHGIKALTDGFWFCIHATDSEDHEHIDETLIAGDSNPAQMALMVEALR